MKIRERERERERERDCLIGCLVFTGMSTFGLFNVKVRLFYNQLYDFK